MLADARLGRSGSLVLIGDAGVGKTALLEFARAQADGFNVQHVVGIESESDLPYAGLHALLRPLVGLIKTLPGRQARALRIALALSSAGDHDRFEAAAGALTLLAEAAEREPLLVVVDDAHWLDRPTTEVLAFVARRLAAESITALFAVRAGEGRALLAEQLPCLEVQPLSEDSAVELLRERWGTAVAPSVARRLAAATGGNPLALVDVPALLSEEERSGHVPLREPLPVSDAVERGVRRTVRTLPTETRHALLLAAVADAFVELDVAALEPAEDAGLVRIHADSVTFRHPLVRSAIYQAAPPEQRRAAHRRLADVFVAEADADRRAWHLAAAAEGPDDAVAEALEVAAGRAAERGGLASESRALERAAELSSDDGDRARRLEAAARAAQLAGEPERCRDLAARARALASDALVRADSAHLWWLANYNLDVFAFDAAEVEEEAARVAPFDPERAGRLLELLVDKALLSFDLQAMLAYAYRAVDVYRSASSEVSPHHLRKLAYALLWHGRAVECGELASEVLATGVYVRGFEEMLVYLERYDDARASLERHLPALRSSGNVYGLLAALDGLVMLEISLGRFTTARAAAAEWLNLAEASANAVAIGNVCGHLACFAAREGRETEARSYVARMAQLSSRGDPRPGERRRTASRIALGLLELGLGRPDAAVEQLRPVAEMLEKAGVREPYIYRLDPDLIEACIRAGEREEAAARLERLQEQAEAVHRRWALAACARLRGFLAEDAEIDEHFGGALVLHDSGPGSPFERARTELLYGERLRRARRRVEAREHLRAAAETFDSLGAAPWSERARVELRASGESIRRRDPTAPEKLTPQELQIALQVADGKTNRDVAAALFLSAKTVEYHLTHIYRKLDLHSRAELIRLFASEATTAMSAPRPPTLVGH